MQARVLAEAPCRGEGGTALSIRKPFDQEARAALDGRADMEVETDEDFARQMQAKLVAQEARRGCAPPPCSRLRSAATVQQCLGCITPCIKVSRKMICTAIKLEVTSNGWALDVLLSNC